MAERLIKLVRDKCIGFSDMRVEYHELDRDDGIIELRRKLVEEAVEYVMDPSMDELADVYQVVEDLAMHDLETRMYYLQAAARAKATRRGRFGKFIGMYGIRDDWPTDGDKRVTYTD